MIMSAHAEERADLEVRPPRDRVAVEAAEAGAAASCGRAMARQAVEPADQLADRDGAFQARQHGAQAHMHARAEGDMAVGLAGRVETVGLGELSGIAVGRADADMDVGARRQALAADLEVGHQPTIAELVGAFEAQPLLDAPSEHAGLLPQPAPPVAATPPA